MWGWLKHSVVQKNLEKEMRATHTHTLRPHILAGQLRSRSTCLCGGHRCLSHYTILRSAGRNSCSSRSHLGQNSPPESNKVFSGICRATGKTAASQKQPAHLWRPAVHYYERCTDPVGKEDDTTQFTFWKRFFLKKDHLCSLVFVLGLLMTLLEEAHMQISIGDAKTGKIDPGPQHFPYQLCFCIFLNAGRCKHLTGKC